MTSPNNRLPLWLYSLAVCGVTLLAAPILALLWNAPWFHVSDTLITTETLAAIRVSLIVSVSTTAIATTLGVPLALALNRAAVSRATPFIRAVVTLPLVLPPVATGVGLLQAFGRQSAFGQLFGFGLANTTIGSIVAATVVAMPFLVLAVEGSLRQTDQDYTQIAATLGATPNQRLWRVTLPAARRAIAAGAVLAWARALGEFGATITFAGNIEGVTRTLPLEVAVAIEQNPDRALTVSLLLVLLSASVLVALRKRWLPHTL